MNEEQRLDSQQVATINSSDKKSAKDYSKYFETVLYATFLKRSKKTWKRRSITMIKILISPEEFKGMGEGRKFYIRTYGCQMNEHDTEVMAGIFLAVLAMNQQIQLKMQM